MFWCPLQMGKLWLSGVRLLSAPYPSYLAPPGVCAISLSSIPPTPSYTDSWAGLGGSSSPTTKALKQKGAEALRVHVTSWRLSWDWNPVSIWKTALEGVRPSPVVPSLCH